MRRLIVILLLLLTAVGYCEIVLIDDIAPKNDAFTVIVDISRIGDAANDTTCDRDDNGVIDYADTAAYAFAGAGGGGDVTDVIGGDGLVDDAATGDITLDVQVGLFLDVNGDSVWLDSTEIVMWNLWIEAYDSVNAWANLPNDNRDSATTHSPLVNEAKDSLTSWANKVNTVYDWGDHSGEGYLTGNETITLSGDVTGSGSTAITTSIAAQSIVPDDIDTTGEDFVFANAYKGTSAEADSEFVHNKALTDTLEAREITTGWGLGLAEGDSVYADSAELDDTFLKRWEPADSTDGGAIRAETARSVPTSTNPTTDAQGEIAVDSDDEAFEVYIADESESALKSFYEEFGAEISTPHNINDTVTIYEFTAITHPHGVEIDQISIIVNGAYTLTLHEYSVDMVWQATTDSIVQASGVRTADTSPMDATLDAGDILRVYLPSTEVDEVYIKIIYHNLDGD